MEMVRGEGREEGEEEEEEEEEEAETGIGRAYRAASNLASAMVGRGSCRG